MKSWFWASLRLWFDAVIVIVCGCASFGRSHVEGRIGGAPAFFVLVTPVVGVALAVVVPVPVFALVAVVVLLLVTIVDPHAETPTIARATAASLTMDVRKRRRGTSLSATRGLIT
jgi:hypothetical protein